jgi:signal transduction histidine kinase
MIIQQQPTATREVETGTAAISVPPPCPNCGEAVLTEVMENFADLALQEERRLLKRMLDAQEQNQQRLAHQIHDGLAQRMIGALLRLQAVASLQQADPEAAANELRVAKKLLRDCIDEARRIANRLRPPSLDDFGIVAGIHHLIAELARNAELDIEFSHEAESLRVPAPLEIAAFRIIQQLLTHVSRHSQTGKVRVELARTDGHVRLEVRDCGIGFDPSIVGKDCFALQEVRERTRLLGGWTVVDSAPGKGTRVVVELPLGNNTPAET